MTVDELVKDNQMLAEVLEAELPEIFLDAIRNQKKGDAPKIIAVCPTLSREDFIRTLPLNHPARIAQEKKERGQ